MQRHKAWTIVAASVLLFSGAALAQDNTTPNTPGTPAPGQQQKCKFTVQSDTGTVTGYTDCTPKTPASNTPAAQQFPFPGEPPANGPAPNATANPSDSSADSTSAPNAPASTGSQSAGQKFPFPGEPAPAATPGSNGGLQDAGSSGQAPPSSSSSSSSSSDDSDNCALSPNDVNCDTPPAPKRGQFRKPEPPPPSLAQREKEDLQVAKFYMDDANYRGAYLRAADAVQIDEMNPDAHLALAEAARHMGKLDEAEKNYRRTLALDPVPKARRKAEDALKQMTGGS